MVTPKLDKNDYIFFHNEVFQTMEHYIMYTERQSVTWMTRTSVSGYFLNTDSKADAGKRKMVERVAARASTVLYGAG